MGYQPTGQSKPFPSQDALATEFGASHQPRETSLIWVNLFLSSDHSSPQTVESLSKM